MNKICFGCGSKLQSSNPEADGFIPENKLKDGAYCQRCFKIMHYGMGSMSSTPKETDVIIRSINGDNKFVIFLADFLSLSTKVMDIFKSIKKDKLLVISKCDIIPKSIREETIRTFIRDYYEISTDVKLVSSVNNYGVDSLTNYLYRRKVFEAYVVGLSNSGKSTLINKLISVNDSNMRQITTSYIPNTTLDFIRIKINEDLMIIDSPGFVIPTIVNISIYQKNNIKVFLKPKTFQMKANETLEIENMYFNFSENTSVTLYMSNDLLVKKYYKPVEFDFDINVKNNNDLLISGLGFLNIKNECNIKTLNINSELFEVRESIFGDNSE